MTAAVTHMNTTHHEEPRDVILPLSCAFYTNENLCGSVNRFIPNSESWIHFSKEKMHTTVKWNFISNPYDLLSSFTHKRRHIFTPLFSIQWHLVITAEAWMRFSIKKRDRNNNNNKNCIITLSYQFWWTVSLKAS